MRTIIHVNQHHIKHNRKYPDKAKPVLTVKVGKDNFYCNEVEFGDGSRVVYRPDNPLPCGAHVWIEVADDIRQGATFPDGYMTYTETKGVKG